MVTASGFWSTVVSVASEKYENVPESLPSVTFEFVKSTTEGAQTASGVLITKTGSGKAVIVVSVTLSAKEKQPCEVSAFVVKTALTVLFDDNIGNVIVPDKLVEVRALSNTPSI